LTGQEGSGTVKGQLEKSTRRVLALRGCEKKRGSARRREFLLRDSHTGLRNRK